MKFKHLIIGAAMFGLATPLTAGAVRAVDATDQTTASSQTTTQTATNQGVANRIENCEKIEAKIQTRLQNYGNDKEKFDTAYHNLVSRLERFVANIKVKGYETIALEADIVELKSKIEEFKTLSSESYTLTQQTSTYTCGQSQGQFMSSLKQTKQKVRVAHQKAAEIRTFYRDVIREDLKDIKTQNPGAVSNSTDSVTSP